MTHTITIYNQKGGVGKTTTAISLGAGLSKQGYKVLFIDLDPQANLTFTLAKSEPAYSILDAITGGIDPLDLIQEIEQGDLIPSTPSLANADLVLKGTGREYKLKELIEPLQGHYDFIIMDTPPTLNILSTNALVASTGLIIPAIADIYSLQGIGQLVQSIRPIQQYCNHDLEIMGLLVTMFNTRTIIGQDMRELLEETAEAIGTKVYKTYIRECTALREAQAKQTDIFSYKPKCNASKDYLGVITEVLNDIKNK